MLDFSFGVNEPEKTLIELHNRGRFKRKPVTCTQTAMAHLCEDMSEHIKYKFMSLTF